MRQARVGDRVEIEVAASVEGHSISQPGARDIPRRFKVGGADAIEGLSHGVIGMKVGDRRTLRIPPQLGFGARNARLVRVVPRSRFSPEMNLHVGKRLVARSSQGKRRHVFVAAVHDDSIVIDGNHPLAGHVLLLDVELVLLTAK